MALTVSAVWKEHAIIMQEISDAGNGSIMSGRCLKRLALKLTEYACTTSLQVKDPHLQRMQKR